MHAFRVLSAYFIVIIIGCLFFVKSKVQVLNSELIAIESNIAKERENIHILKAELAYLSKPQLIEKLAAKHLDLQIMRSDQMVNIEISEDSRLKIFESKRR